MARRLSRNPPSSTTSCVPVCLCALLPVVPLNKVHPLPFKQPPSVSLPLGHLSCCFRGWGVETSLQRRPDGGVEPFPTGPLCGPPWPPGHLGHGRAPPPALVPQGCPDPVAPAPPQVAFCPGHINLCPGQLAEAGGQTGQIPRACRQSGCRVTRNSPGPGLQRAEGRGQRGELPCVFGPSGIWRGEAALTPAGHRCRSTGCLASSGPEQHRASTSSLAVQGSPGTLHTAVNHLCSYSIDKLLRPHRAQDSWTNCMPQILAAHCLTAEPWQGASTVTEPQFPQSHSHSRPLCGQREPCRPLTHRHHLH